MIGRNIRQLRLSAKLTQVQLAETLGIKRNDLVNWELERSKPSIENVKLFCEYFTISIDDLYNKDLSKYEEPLPKGITEEKQQPPQHNYEREMIAVLMEGNALMRVRNEQHEKQQEAMMTMLSTLTQKIVSNSEIEAAKAKALAIQNKTLLRMMEEVLSATLKKPMEHVAEMTNRIKHEVLMELSD